MGGFHAGLPSPQPSPARGEGGCSWLFGGVGELDLTGIFARVEGPVIQSPHRSMNPNQPPSPLAGEGWGEGFPQDQPRWNPSSIPAILLASRLPPRHNGLDN